jgi:NAD(P)-dependent dehydrogenase (short-subunit alcohol dehydrogenase family)
MKRFEGKAVLVTGGGSGLGAAVARQVSREGGRAAVVDLDADRAGELAAELGGVAIAMDVADEASVATGVRRAVEALGRLDGVVNCAGHVVLRRFEKLRLEEWNRMLAVHATGTFLVCREAHPSLREAGGGSIVNIASTGGLIGLPYLTAYAAAKGAIIALSRQLAVELAPDGIRVNVVAPGDTRTGMTTPLWHEVGSGDLAAGEAKIASANLLGRVAEADEVAAAICFLLGPEGSYCTGTTLVVDGGVTAV